MEVEKLLERSGDLVHTLEYRYQVTLQGRGGVLRYDNSHGPAPHYESDNPTAQRETWHHRHELEWFDPSSPRTPEELPGPDYDIEWPHLSDVLDEVVQWYHTHGEVLEHRYMFADPALCSWDRFVYCSNPPKWSMDQCCSL